MSDLLSNILLLANFIPWIKETLHWVPAGYLGTFIGLYIVFYVATFSHVVFSSFTLLGFKQTKDIVWYRFFWVVFIKYCPR